MALIIVLGLLGVFGTGPLSDTTSGYPDAPLSLSYQRFVRHDGQDILTVRVAPDQVSNGTVDIWLSRAYLDGIEFRFISPEPTDVRTDGERLIYSFAVEDPVAPLLLSFFIQPQAIGPNSGELGIVGGPQLSFSQFGFP